MWPFAWRTYRSKPIARSQRAELNTSQAKVAGFDLGKCQSSKVLIVGAGALGSATAYMLARKGVAGMVVLDDDRVELANLTRQLYGRDEIGKHKSFALAHGVCQDALFPLRIVGYRERFQEAVEHRSHLLDTCDPWLVLVDNDQTRHDACVEALRRNKKLIGAAVARDASSLYCAVQEPNGACLACIRSQLAESNSEYPCNLPGIIDVSMMAASLVVYAVDSVLSGRPRLWNHRTIVLDGSMPDRGERVAKNPDCPLCSHLAVVDEAQLPLPMPEVV